ncbi:MAG: PTS IIA-like nitrogen regulatory protein PtsN [Pseudomonadota bacterium]
MELADIVSGEAVLASVKASSKKQVLQEIAHKASDLYGLHCGTVVNSLVAREKLGSTAMGHGVAIPHARLEGLDRILGVFARLEKPVDFEAADSQGVDLVFALLAPEEADANHLRALAKVSRTMRDESIRAKLRASDNAAALHALLTEIQSSTRAA